MLGNKAELYIFLFGLKTRLINYNNMILLSLSLNFVFLVDLEELTSIGIKNFKAAQLLERVQMKLSVIFSEYDNYTLNYTYIYNPFG